jgi:hypothetical protein
LASANRLDFLALFFGLRFDQISLGGALIIVGSHPVGLGRRPVCGNVTYAIARSLLV